MLIHKNFTGGNISVKEQIGNTFILENELRDTTENWFYWAFCVEGAENQTLTFVMQKHRLGYFGPAISHDLIHWQWLDRINGDSFTYHFEETEHKVYFAHSLLYHPNRFLQFAQKHNLKVDELCKGYKGSSIPCVQFGGGKTSIILTARHHACESPGNYVLEGVLEELLTNPIPNMNVFCVPFVDYEGVIRGDQGKSRAPHDHNRDYSLENPCIYPECNAIKEYAEQNGCHFGFDFHAPWHISSLNDTVFIVQNSIEKLDRLTHFGQLFEAAITKNALQYFQKDDCPPEISWNKATTQFASYMTRKAENNIAFSLETTYFGTAENKVTNDKLLELGHCFAKALRNYIAEENRYANPNL